MSITWTQEQYLKAYRFAAEVHNGQKFPGTEFPYIMHLSFVCMEIIAALTHEPERDGNLAIQCALLHDVIEDARPEKKIDYKVSANYKLNKQLNLNRRQIIPETMRLLPGAGGTK